MCQFSVDFFHFELFQVGVSKGILFVGGHIEAIECGFILGMVEMVSSMVLGWSVNSDNLLY